MHVQRCTFVRVRPDRSEVLQLTLMRISPASLQLTKRTVNRSPVGSHKAAGVV